MADKILVVDDDRSALEALQIGLETLGYEVVTRDTFDGGSKALEDTGLALLVADLELGAESGLDLVARANELNPDLPAIIVTGHASVSSAVEAMRVGVWDYLLKPVNLDELEAHARRAIKHMRLGREVEVLRQAASPQLERDLIGKCSAMKELRDLVGRVAKTDVGVLLTGESGTGKEVVARTIHRLSGRADGPFVPVNCAALPETLLESELFGHVRGAFTDARRERRGLFLEANGGTLLLDEIGELPMAMQPKLLRALQESKVRRVGSDEAVDFDTRVIAATNRDPEEAIEQGLLRPDLYYRLNVVQIDLPPLRVRGDDIIILAQSFIERFAVQHEVKVTGLTSAAADKLLLHHWPGNVRELMNAVERAVALARSELIDVEDLPERVRNSDPTRRDPMFSSGDDMPTLEEVQRRYIAHVLEATDGNKSQAARILGVDRKTLFRRLKREEEEAADDGDAT